MDKNNDDDDDDDDDDDHDHDDDDDFDDDYEVMIESSEKRQKAGVYRVHCAESTHCT